MIFNNQLIINYNSIMEIEEVIYHINSGLTPHKVEQAYSHKKVRELVAMHNVEQRDVSALALRWGIR